MFLITGIITLYHRLLQDTIRIIVPIPDLVRIILQGAVMVATTGIDHHSPRLDNHIVLLQARVLPHQTPIAVLQAVDTPPDLQQEVAGVTVVLALVLHQVIPVHRAEGDIGDEILVS